ncbi:MAG TPA: LacI family DNA-binding transcriptional regulator, partial [Acidimicrobiales bacterium]|nr:LacI family DNA-binding transcriptional regulator [Acidimicrobiales bacterium]
MSRAPAMTDVARLAGVSHQTVSRVLNDHPSVRPSTRDRVLQAIEELGYRPNLAARALVTGRSATLGLVTLDTTLFGPVATLYGIERAARDAGYYVSVVSLRALDPDSVGEALQRLAAQAVAGVVVIAPLASAGGALTDLPSGLPVVVVEGDLVTEAAVVTVDQRAGARMATEHLLALGHRTVSHVAGPEEWTEARQRAAGWREALEAAGAPLPPILTGDWTARSGYEAGCRLASEKGVSA